MANYWRKAGIPHKGWKLIDVIDTREYDGPGDEPEYEVCMMCGNEKIRYVHILEHPEQSETIEVGCICAEKMTEDYINPQKRERNLRNRTNRKKTWLKKIWKNNGCGGYYIEVAEHFVFICRDSTGKFKVSIDDTEGRKQFSDFHAAILAAFNGVEYFKEKGQW